MMKHRIEHAGATVARTPWFQVIARGGMLMRGAAYLIIGLMALLGAWDLGGDYINMAGVMQQFTGHRAGLLILALIVVGNVGYALFKFVGAVCDTDGKGAGAIGIIKRCGMFVRGLFHAGMAVVALNLIRGVPAPDRTGDSYAQSVAMWLSSWRNGAWLVVTLGIYLLAIAALQLYAVYTAYFRRRLKLEELTPGLFHLIVWLGRAGCVSRAVIALLMGVFMVISGWKGDPHLARGVGGVLKELSSHPYAPPVIGLLAVGLCAYGVFELLLVRYRRIVAAGDEAETIDGG